MNTQDPNATNAGSSSGNQQSSQGDQSSTTDSSNGNQQSSQGGQSSTPITPQIINADITPATAQPFKDQGDDTNAGTTQTQPQPPVPHDPNARSGQLGDRSSHIFTIPPHPHTKFDDSYFLTLLEGSISLTIEEKQKVIDAIPRLSIEQINELIAIFEEEKQKFAELEQEFAQDVAKLKNEREKELDSAESKKIESNEEEEDKAQAEALKAQLGK